MSTLLRNSVLSGCVLVFCSVACGEDALPQYFQGLRERQLFVVAESEAIRRLHHKPLSAAQRAILTVELSKTYAAHAAYATGEEQRELWTQADAIVSDLLLADPRTRFAGVLHAQRAMVPAARGAQLRWQAELYPLDATARNDAVAILREALDRLDPLPAAIDNDIQIAQSRPFNEADRGERPTPHQLYRLKRLVEFTIAAASLDLAKVLPVGADQTAALLTADKQFDALTRLARPDDIAWQSRVDRLDILRLKGEYDRLAGQVTALLKSDPPRSVADGAIAVLVRRWLDENRPDEALAALEEYRKQYGLESGELQALVVRTLLAARRMAIDKDDTKLAAELLVNARSIDARLSGSWKNYAAVLLERAGEEERYGPAMAGSVREAQWAWRSGDIDGAIKAYTRAAAAAHQAGEAEMAVEFGLSISSAQVESGRYQDAVVSLGQLLEAYPQHEQAGKADLLRAYSLGRLFEQQPTDQRKQTYRDALESHRSRFATQASFAEATWMLARLADYEQNTEEAISLLKTIPPESTHYPAAISRLSAIFETAIQLVRQREEPAADWEQRALETLTPIASGFPPSPEPLSLEQSEVARRLAWILLHQSPPHFVRADELLQHIIDSSPTNRQESSEPDPAWRSQLAAASQLRIISLAGQSRLSDARELLDQVAADDPARMLDILNGLTGVAADVGLEHRTGIAKLQLELAETLKAKQSSLPENEQRALDLALAEAYSAVGKWQPAAQIYEELLWKDAQDREVVAALANVYEECGSLSCLREALKQWKSLEAMQRKGSIEWIESRYHLAWCSHRLGDDETASKLIGVTRVLYPQLGTPSLKLRYETLAAELDTAQK